MKFKTVKTAAEIALKGVRIELEIVDKDIRGVLITDADGKVLRIQKMEQYSNNLSLQIPHKESADKFRVTAKLYKGYSFETEVSKTVDTESEAQAMKSELESKEAQDITIEKIEVAMNNNDVAPPADDIPF